MTLGQRIQELRKGCDLSQEALGEKLGVSRQAVSRWEMDGAVPEVDKLIAMSRIFGISLNDLLQVEGPEELPGAEPEPGPAEGEPAPAASKRAGCCPPWPFWPCCWGFPLWSFPSGSAAG